MDDQLLRDELVRDRIRAVEEFLDPSMYLQYLEEYVLMINR